MMNFQTARGVRKQWKGNTGRFRGGRLEPVMMHAVRESEGGMIQQSLSIELDPIPGRLISEITAQMVTVFVPLQAMDYIKDPAAGTAGMTDVVRDKLLSTTPLFATEPEGVISRRAKVNPRSVAGVKRVNEACRLAYNCAVNMLRQRAYFRAALVAHTNTAILPAIYSQNVLDRINGVLDPEDRINGQVNLTIPAMTLPVSGIGISSTDIGAVAAQNIRRKGGAASAQIGNGWIDNPDGGTVAGRARVAVLQDPANPGYPDISAIFGGAGTTMGLDDFYNAQLMDDFARQMDQMMRDNPTFGEEMVLRWAHGLNVDAGRTPFILAEREVLFNKMLQGATDTTGVNDDVLRTDGMVKISVAVPIPRTELGGMIVTLIAIKPDEKLASQPEPFLSDVWTHQNYVADSMALDPVPVTVRELFSDCAAGDEPNVVAYTGLNALKQTYIDYGFSRDTNLTLVDNKTAIFQLDVPLSVNATNINYPDYVDHGVFAFGGTVGSPTDVATFSITSIQSSPSPMIVGPTPIEDIPTNADTVWQN